MKKFIKSRERLIQKVGAPTLYDMVNGERDEVYDAMIAMIKNNSISFEELIIYATPSPRGWLATAKAFDKVIDKQPAINNHICPHCKNERVSKNEKSCWLCGGKL